MKLFTRMAGVAILAAALLMPTAAWADSTVALTSSADNKSVQVQVKGSGDAHSLQVQLGILDADGNVIEDGGSFALSDTAKQARVAEVVPFEGNINVIVSNGNDLLPGNPDDFDLGTVDISSPDAAQVAVFSVTSADSDAALQANDGADGAPLAMVSLRDANGGNDTNADNNTDNVDNTATNTVDNTSQTDPTKRNPYYRSDTSGDLAQTGDNTTAIVIACVCAAVVAAAVIGFLAMTRKKKR